NFVRLSRIDERDGLRTGNGAAQHNGQAESEAQANGATTNLPQLRYLCEHRDGPLPCVSSVQVPAAAMRCASRPAALLPPRANSNRMLCPRPAPGSGSLGDTVFASILSRRQRGGVKQSRLISVGPARPIGGAMRFGGAGAMACSAGLLSARLGSRRHLGRRQRRKPLQVRRGDAPQRQDEFTAAKNEERKRERNDVV